MNNNINTLRDLLSVAQGVSQELMHDALAALAELEKSSGRSSARMSWEICGCQTPPTHYVGTMPCPLNPTPPPVKPAPQFVAGEVSDTMARKLWREWFDASGITGVESAHFWLKALRRELGPALGLVEIREPTAEECERINWLAHNTLDALAETQEVRPEAIGRAMFAAVAEWLKGEL